ncbi:MAG: DNA polymerase III subunit beta [Actinomycetia bacterium]|nr:DNA polymerase III subunit beta [Actinomycetes bacterium]
MKFRCERDVLVDALGTAGRASTTRNVLPVLSGLRLALEGNRLQITGSDLDLTITVAIEVAGAADGVVVLPAKLAADIVRHFEPGAIEVDASGDRPRVSGGRSEFFINAMPADEYPSRAEPTGESVTLAAGDLAEGLRQVVKAASRDDSRPVLTGVLMTAEDDGLRLVSTDSYRLAVRDLPGAAVLRPGQQVLVPSRALDEVSRLLEDDAEVTIVLGESDVTFEIGELHISTKLIMGDFPDYRKLIPATTPQALIIGRQALMDALRRVKLMAAEHTPVRLSMRPDLLELRTVNTDLGEAVEELDAKYDGEELAVAFNPEYLLQGLEVTVGDEVSIESTDGSKPATMRSVESGEFLYLLMPVRVS